MIVTKYVCQHSETLPKETMDFLHGIAEDYAKVKTTVYERYSGVRSVGRLQFLYTIDKEMRACGLRQRLNLPVVYYEAAVKDAVTNIKVMWCILKNKIREKIKAKDNLSASDCMYIRTVLRLDNVLAAVLNRRNYEMPRNVDGVELDIGHLNNLICRLVRRYLTKPKVHVARQFKVNFHGYKYSDGGIYLTSRIFRKRIYLPLKDALKTTRQISVCIKESSVDIQIPADVECLQPVGDNTIYAYIGYRDAVTLSNGHVYGKDLHLLVTPETERLNNKNIERSKAWLAYEQSKAVGDALKAKRIERNNLGRKKYDAIKQRIRERTQSYIMTFPHAIRHLK